MNRRNDLNRSNRQQTSNVLRGLAVAGMLMTAACIRSVGESGLSDATTEGRPLQFSDAVAGAPDTEPAAVLDGGAVPDQGSPDSQADGAQADGTPLDASPPDASPPDAAQADGPCAPDCAGKECGDDGCGGSCGKCYWDRHCNSEGQCRL